jgi:hypothetical protein
MAFIPLKDFLSKWHLELIGLIGLRAVSEINYKYSFLEIFLGKIPLILKIQIILFGQRCPSRT